MKVKNILKKLCTFAFLFFVFGLMFVGMIKTFFFSKDVNLYENRNAYKVSEFTLDSYMDGSYQDNFENAFTDQVLFAQTFKKAYNDITSKFLYKCMMTILENNSNRYVSFMNKMVIGGDYVVYGMRDFSKIEPALDAKIDNINQYIEKHPDIDMYIYYIERDTDINFETNEKLGAYEYLRDKINLPESNIGKYEVVNFEDYKKKFHRTDHHWNYYGSYQGYLQVMNLLGETPLIKPEETVQLNYRFSGAKARTSGTEAVFSEAFTAYRYNYPDMNITINGKAVDDYGNQEGYFANTASNISYGAFYGGDNGETVFDTGNTDKENILIIGESFDNAILKLVASQYNRTYSIDLRNYERSMGEKFKMADYMQAHNIDKVLLIGNVDFYVMEEFNLED